MMSCVCPRHVVPLIAEPAKEDWQSGENALHNKWMEHVMSLLREPQECFPGIEENTLHRHPMTSTCPARNLRISANSAVVSKAFSNINADQQIADQSPAASMMTMPPKSPESPHWQWQLLPARPQAVCIARVKASNKA